MDENPSLVALIDGYSAYFIAPTYGFEVIPNLIVISVIGMQMSPMTLSGSLIGKGEVEVIISNSGLRLQRNSLFGKSKRYL
jgi:hypothetical protein